VQAREARELPPPSPSPPGFGIGHHDNCTPRVTYVLTGVSYLDTPPQIGLIWPYLGRGARRAYLALSARPAPNRHYLGLSVEAVESGSNRPNCLSEETILPSLLMFRTHFTQKCPIQLTSSRNAEEARRDLALSGVPPHDKRLFGFIWGATS